MVMESPTRPEFADKAVMDGVTRKDAALLAIAFTVTTTLAVPAGKLVSTGTWMDVSLQKEGVTLTPPIVTGLKFWAAPNPLPLMVRVLFTEPEAGERLAMAGETR